MIILEISNYGHMEKSRVWGDIFGCLYNKLPLVVNLKKNVTNKIWIREDAVWLKQLFFSYFLWIYEKVYSS